MNLITLRNRQLKTVISTLGAELMSIRDTNDVERLWQGNAQWWAGRAPILFPMAGGLRDDRYLLEGKSYPMPKHGYVRRMEWMLEDATDTRAIFLIQEKDAGFPFDYDLRAVFELEKNALKVTYRICNRGRRGFAFGLGSHEGYATPEGIESSLKRTSGWKTIGDTAISSPANRLFWRKTQTSSLCVTPISPRMRSCFQR